MAKTTILQTFSLPRRNVVGLALVNNKVWVGSSTRNKIYHGEIDERGRYSAIGKITSQVAKPTGLAWDGKKLYVADRTEGKIFTADREMQKMKLVLSLKRLRPDKIPLVFLIPTSEITDITWGRGHLWFTCKAGYSSSFYCLDIGNKKVVHQFKARGPEPEGISFDSQEKHIWTLDASNRELSQFTPEGKWTGQSLPTPLDKPMGLTIDDKDTFWITDLKTMKLCQLKEEGS